MNSLQLRFGGPLRATLAACAVVALAFAPACKDPSKGKTAAKVTAPHEEPGGSAKGKTSTSKPAGAATKVGTASGTGAPAAVKGTKLALAPAHGTIGFTGSKVTGSHDGKFQKFNGTLTLNDKQPELSQVSVDIEIASVKTDRAKLDRHLRSDDFFAALEHPEAHFVSTKIAKGGAKGATHTITGNLTLRGVKKGISFPATVKVSASHVEVKSEFKINRKDFGVSYSGMKDNLIRDHVVIRLDFKVPRKG